MIQSALCVRLSIRLWTGTCIFFPLISCLHSPVYWTATAGQISQICKSADRYLYNAAIGGYRLNTDFKELKFDMGRMFGFAYGEKENGAVFSHMTVYLTGCGGPAHNGKNLSCQHHTDAFIENAFHRILMIIIIAGI